MCSHFLKCSIPAFEGLLEGRHDRRLTKLLYRLSEWHALAKLRMHTDTSLDLMEEYTKELGVLLREFRRLTCSQFSTVELPREADARVRQRKKDPTTQHSDTAPTGVSQFPTTSTNAISQRHDQNTAEKQVPNGK